MVNILFISNNNTNDFLSDSVFHGFKTIDNISVYEENNMWYMYDDIDKRSLVNRFHGRGFGYYGLLDKSTQILSSNIEYEIKNKTYDYIIYANVHRNLNYIDIVLKYYDYNNIIFLDGEDHTNIKDFLIGKGLYFKREIQNYSDIVKPISFSFPKSNMFFDEIEKSKLIATVIPGHMNTFIYDNESDYYMDYRKSLFGFTWKKSGWDCLRHYEILSNYCIPLFLDIEYCPTNICTTLPKNILINFYKESGIYDLYKMNDIVYYDDKNTLITNRDVFLIKNIDIYSIYDIYTKYIDILAKYTINNLTTTNIANYIIKVSNENNI